MSIVMARVLLMAAESHLGCLALFAQRLRANGQPKRSHNYCYVNREDSDQDQDMAQSGRGCWNRVWKEAD